MESRIKKSKLTVLAEKEEVEAMLDEYLPRENGGWRGEGIGEGVYISNLVSVIDGNSKATKLTINHPENLSFLNEKMPYTMFDMMISSLRYKQEDNRQDY